jgi:hypothetical protein
LLQIIDKSPFGTHISLEFFTHSFRQSSIIARFEPKVRNATHPLTILGAHQDSANYMFPLLPAPGADDDCSGTVTILETFHILAESGYIPKNGPVEFHWYVSYPPRKLPKVECLVVNRSQDISYTSSETFTVYIESELHLIRHLNSLNLPETGSLLRNCDEQVCS